MPTAIADGLVALRPEGVTIALLDATRRYAPSFWLDAFQTRIGPLHRDGRAASPGYYLFQDQRIVAHHAGGVHAEHSAIVAHFRPSLTGAPRETHHESWVYEDSPRADRTPPPAEPPPPPSPPAFDPYEVLGVPPTCTDQELKAAYRQAIKANHPDRVAHLSPALQRFALEQTLLIQQAWDALKGGRGR